MSRFRSYLTALVMTASVSLLPNIAGAQEGKVDLTGKWQLAVKTSAGTGTPTLTLTQQGDSLTGHYSSAVLGESDLAGTFKAGKINFSFKAAIQGTSVAVTYTGAVEADGTLKGEIDIGGQATGTFTAKRL
ncbi:MAG: hypothetical protein V4550_21155 [Gemmatimonadota bacterium]